jgi:hypothetical protein
MSAQGGIYTPHCKSYCQLNWSMHWCTHESRCSHMETHKVALNPHNQRTHYVYCLADYMSNTLCHAPGVNQFTLFTDTVRSVDWALWPVCHTQPPPATFSKSVPLLHTLPKPLPYIPTTLICKENFLSMVLQCSGIRGWKCFSLPSLCKIPHQGHLHIS